MEQTTQPNYILSTRNFKGKDTYRWKRNGWWKISHGNINQKRAGVAKLISDRADFKVRRLTGAEEGRHIMNIMIKEPILPKERHNNSQCVRTSQSKPHAWPKTRQKCREKRVNPLSQLATSTPLYQKWTGPSGRTQGGHSGTQQLHQSRGHNTHLQTTSSNGNGMYILLKPTWKLTQTDLSLGCKTHLNRFKRSKIMQCPDQNGTELEWTIDSPGKSPNTWRLNNTSKKHVGHSRNLNRNFKILWTRWKL